MTDETGVDVLATDLMDVDVAGLDRLNPNGSLPLPDEACLVCGQRHECVFTLSGHYLRDGCGCACLPTCAWVAVLRASRMKGVVRCEHP